MVVAEVIIVATVATVTAVHVTVVDCQNTEPVPRDRTSTDKNQVSHGSVIKDLINI
jgi:hypothetical protein